MKYLGLAIFVTLFGIVNPAVAEELKIEFSDEAKKAFGDKPPLGVEAIRKDGEIQIVLTNRSPKHVIITRDIDSNGSHYEDEKGSKIVESGWATLSAPKEFRNHIVMRPQKEDEGGMSFSEWTVLKIPETREGGGAYVFDAMLSGYFPTVDQYLEFSIVGRVVLKKAQ